MKFALLGLDAAALEFVRAVAAGDAHQLVWISFAAASAGGADAKYDSELAEQVRRLAPLAQESADWELLLCGTIADAIIVAGGPPRDGRFEQLRRLVQERVPVVVSHPITFSVLEAYELEVVRGETGGVVVPLLPARWYAPTRQLAQIVQASRTTASENQPIGRIEQIGWDRQLVDRSRSAVLSHFARDVDFVRTMCGEITQIAALGADESDFSRLGVQMTGPAGILVRWGVQLPESRPGARITLIGQAGRLTLEMPEAEEPGQWKIQPAVDITVPKQRDDFELDTGANLADLVARSVRRAMAGRTAPGEATWSDATRSLELVEALEKSLRKGRTVTLSFEGRGEAEAFKGTMASVGCGLIVAGLVLALVAAVLDKVAAKSGNETLIRIFRWWPALLALLLVVFLLLQFLRLIIPGREAPPGKPVERPDGPALR